MTFRTHREFSLLVTIPATIYLYRADLLPMNYYLALIITIVMGKAGAWFPDLDHHWEAVKEKNSLNFVFNKILRGTGAKHRSRHTHSIDILLLLMLIAARLPIKLFEAGVMTEVDAKVFSIISLGFLAGWLSHIISDMLTSDGVYLFCWNKRKISFVPKKIGKLRFNTGHAWENWVYRRTTKITGFLLLLSVLYPIFVILLGNPEKQAMEGFVLLLEKLKQLFQFLGNYM